MTSKFSYVKPIDTLRAFAVLSVMIFHLNPLLLPGGFSGVDVFFVISGYVVCASLLKNYNSSFFKFVIDFYGRRIIRIVPLLLVFLLVTTIFTTLFIPSSWLSDSTNKTGLFAFFGFSNYALVWFNDGYFSPRVEYNPFVHTWSLSVEEQFYILFPFIFFIWHRFKNSENFIVSLLSKYFLLLVIIASLVYSSYETYSYANNAYYLLPSRFWELACGALLYKFHSENKLLFESKNLYNSFIIIGLLLICIGFVFSDAKMFPFPWALFSVFGTLFMLIGFVSCQNKLYLFKNVFENKILIFIGKISFSLYLWHWAVYVLLRWTIGLESTFQMFLAVTITFVFSILSYYFVENYFRQNKYLKSKSKLSLVLLGILSIFFVYQASKMIFDNQEKLSLSVTKQKEIWYPLAQSKSFSDIEVKSEFPNRKIFVFGDSHTGAYSTMLNELSLKYKIKVIQFSSAGCGVADFHSMSISKNKACQNYISNVIQQITDIAKADDILFLASLRLTRFADQYAVFPEKDVLFVQNGESAIENRKLIIEDTRKLLRKLDKLNLNIIIDAPKPIFKAPAFRCSDWFNKNNPICKNGFNEKKSYLLDYRKSVVDSIMILKKDFKNLTVWDPFPILCKSENCSAFENGKPLFFDADHLSAYGNIVLFPHFAKVIENILLKK